MKHPLHIEITCLRGNELRQESLDPRFARLWGIKSGTVFRDQATVSWLYREQRRHLHIYMEAAQYIRAAERKN